MPKTKLTSLLEETAKEYEGKACIAHTKKQKLGPCSSRVWRYKVNLTDVKPMSNDRAVVLLRISLVRISFCIGAINIYSAG
jgi:hypothetical protein